MPDLRLAVRTLRATPVVTVVAVLSLALGIGANTAIFSLVDSLLLRTLPVPHPERLVAVSVGGTRIARDPTHADGWDYGAGNESIQLYGAACTQAQNGSGQNVQIVFGCPGVVIN